MVAVDFDQKNVPQKFFPFESIRVLVSKKLGVEDFNPKMDG